jgi:glycosyltransferase involved in cell wall biosynthesis
MSSAYAGKIAIVAVTFNRPVLLKSLLHSISCLEKLPDYLVVIDNNSTSDTDHVILGMRGKFPSGVLHVHKLPKNIGGSGGFHEGVRIARGLGADWFWLMDDDVEVLPDGLERLKNWSNQFKCIHGRRYDFDGSDFFWQPVFSEWIALPLPYLKNPFKERNYFLTNSGCFEGMFIHREVVNQIGLPDPRFFITWDDAMYGWLASKVVDVAYVNEFVIKRTRQSKQVNLGIRHLNEGSDLFRFHVIRNREYVRNYLKEKNTYHPIGFLLGTALNFLKEIFRMIVVERSLKGFSAVIKGAKAARQIKRASDWKLMPKLLD